MFCKNCGNQLPDDARFCPNCGCSNSASNIPNIQQTQSAPVFDQQTSGYGYAQHYNRQNSLQPQCEKKKLPKILFIAFGSVAAVVILIIILAVVFSGKSSRTTYPTAVYKPVDQYSDTVPDHDYTDTDADLGTSYSPETDAPIDSPQKTSLDLYYPTIKNYGKKRAEHEIEMGREAEIPKYRYAIKDINSDGIDELIIDEEFVYDDDGTTVQDHSIQAIYTLDGDKPVDLFSMGEHGSYTISSDGYFIFSYHDITIEKLVGTELVLVAESERLDWENYENERDNFLKNNGVSTREMIFNFTTYNG